MSCNEWEAGTLKLPSVEYPKVKEKVRQAMETHANMVFQHTQNFWKALPAKFKRDTELYRSAAYAYAMGNIKLNTWDRDVIKGLPAWTGIPSDENWSGIRSDTSHALNSVLHKPATVTQELFNGKTHTYQTSVAAPPRRVLQADMKRLFPCTNRTLSFALGESYLSFDAKAKTVHWEVGENNHAREHGREHPVALAFFWALDAVTWTRGSGGKIVGNDEYNQDSQYEGGGGNYVVDEYGPKVNRRPAYGQNPYNLRSW